MYREPYSQKEGSWNDRKGGRGQQNGWVGRIGTNVCGRRFRTIWYCRNNNAEK